MPADAILNLRSRSQQPTRYETGLDLKRGSRSATKTGPDAPPPPVATGGGLRLRGLTTFRPSAGAAGPVGNPMRHHSAAPAKLDSTGTAKVGKVMREYKAGALHSSSKKGPKVKNRKQAIAIALSEGRKTMR